MQIDRHADREIDSQTDRQTDRHRDMSSYRQTAIQPDRQAD